MSHGPAAPAPAHVSRVPRTLLDRVAQWWRTSTLTLWAVAGAAGLFQLMVLNVASYTYPHLPMRAGLIVSLLLAGSLLARAPLAPGRRHRHELGLGRRRPVGAARWTQPAVHAGSLALLVIAPTHDRLIGSASARCAPSSPRHWPSGRR